ncbi:hypothetical protein M0R72_08015 [Candidatus Pacearchaeota archaeon]|jgi:hypothetical protein|nr:hypothetical protein [Candidatus Pacearchaeota archaeon]
MPTKTKPIVKPPSPAQIQRVLEKKNGVIPSPWWMDFAGQDVRIDGVLAAPGKELIFKCVMSGVVCGAGVFCAAGLMRFSAAYGNDPYETRKSGKITGLQTNEGIEIFDANGKQYDYHPQAIFAGYQRVMLTELWTMK